jgi:tetratricopeptide (TPR) repeat protein
MATPFLSSEEYDERAHRHYDDGNYDAALDTLKEGLRLYPHSVELYVGLGYTRLAREEYVWAKQAFERALVLDPEHDDGLVGLGEALLRFGCRDEALSLFERARDVGAAEDLDVLLTMGRALYRERLYREARDVFEAAVVLHPNSAEAAAAFGYTLHRLEEETAARRQLRRALHLDSEYHEARIYLGHLLYDRGDWVGAAREFARVSPAEHWDALALWRLLDLKRALEGLPAGSPELEIWERRLADVEGTPDPIEELLAEVEANAQPTEASDPLETSGVLATDADGGAHRVCLPEGDVVVGTWAAIVEQLRQRRAPGETIAQFMRRTADEAHARAGVTVATADARSIVVAGARAGFWKIEY